MYMKTIISSLLMVAMMMPAIAQKKKEIKPTVSVAKVTLVGKKEYSYYALSEKSKTQYVVTGPGKLTLNYRVRIEDNSFESKPFQVNCYRSDKTTFPIEVGALKSGNLKFKSTKLVGSPTVSEKIELDIPPGKHTLKFYKVNTKQKVYMKALYAAAPKPKWTEVDPNPPLVKKDVKFVKSGTVRSYNQVSKENGFTFETSNQALYRVIVRPEFSYRMLDETTVKLEIKNITTGDVKVYKFNPKRSSKLEFVDDKKNIPGTKSTFYLNLGTQDGKPEKYEVRLVSGAKNGLVRISKDSNGKQS